MKVSFKRMTLAASLAVSLIAPTAALADTQPLTRGAFIQLIADELQLAPVSKQTPLPQDVPGDSPYADAARVMIERKIMSGYSDGTFRLEQAITPQESSYILGRFLGLSDEQASDTLDNQFDVQLDNNLSAASAPGIIRSALHSDASAIEWLTEATHSQNELTSFSADVDMLMNLFFKPGQLPEGMSSVETKAVSSMAYNKDYGIYQNTKTIVPAPQGNIEVSVEQYIVKDGSYMKMADPYTGSVQWFNTTKLMPFSYDQLLEMQKVNSDLSQFVNDSFFYRDLGSYESDDKQLHKIGINGKIASAADIAKALSSLGSDQSMLKDVLDSPAIAQMSLALSGEMIFDEASKMPVSMDVNYWVTFGDMTEVPLEAMQMSMNMTYKDLNQVGEIKLPEEAKQAPPFELPTTQTVPAEQAAEPAPAAPAAGAAP